MNIVPRQIFVFVKRRALRLFLRMLIDGRGVMLSGRSAALADEASNSVCSALRICHANHRLLRTGRGTPRRLTPHAARMRPLGAADSNTNLRSNRTPVFQRSALGRKHSALIKPYLLGEPLPGRRQPVKAASREAGARNAPALTGWRWSGLLGFKQARLALWLTTPARAFCPSSIRCRRHCA